MKTATFETPEQYIAQFPAADQAVLKKIRAAIRKALPTAEEVISYQMPTFKVHGAVIYYASCKAHYAVYIPPTYGVYEAFKKELKPYKLTKSAAQFPKSEAIPYELIQQMAEYAGAQNELLAKKKTAKAR